MNFNSEKREIIRRCISNTAMNAKEIAEKTGITKSHVMGTLNKLVKAKLVESYPAFDPKLGKDVNYYIKRENSPGAKEIKFSQEQHEAQCKHARSEIKSSRTYVGISQVYNG